jgi:hypothetical protein
LQDKNRPELSRLTFPEKAQQNNLWKSLKQEKSPLRVSALENAFLPPGGISSRQWTHLTKLGRELGRAA